MATAPQRIERFWTWWAESEDRIGAALTEPEGRVTAIDEVRFRVARAGLEGDVLMGGRVPLVIGSASGNANHRLRAAHWLIGAPPTDRFAFATHRPPQPLPELLAATLPGKPPVPIETLRFTPRWRELDDRVDVRVHLGAAMRHRQADEAGPRVLRSALGELEAEAWLGNVSVATEPLDADALHLADLLEALAAEIAVRQVPRWQELRFEKAGAPPLVVLLRRPLHPAHHPFLDTCLAITHELIDDDPDEPERMRRQLTDDMPSDALLVGAVLRGRQHTALVYVNGSSPTVGVYEQRAQLLGGRQQANLDPDWRTVRRFAQADPSAELH
ncbi:MAG: hypothetical protein PGN13_03150 [Patulibacter minatonensis]